MSNTTCPMPDRRPTPAEILDTPLPLLLADWGVDAYASEIRDRTFFGACGTREGGQLFLALPSGRSDFETDTTARYLLAQAFGVDLPDLPPPFETTHLT